VYDPSEEWFCSVATDSLLASLHGNTAYIIHRVPAGTTYGDIAEVLKVSYRDHQRPTNNISKPGSIWGQEGGNSLCSSMVQRQET
jgi:hypothetical protein